MRLTDIVWKEVSPGVYEKPFDLVESFSDAFKMSHLPGRELFMVTAGIKVKYPGANKDQFVQAVKNAWIAARHNNPLIACIKGEGKLIYQTPRNLQEIQDWVKDSFVVVADYTSAEVQEKAPGFIKDYAMLVVFPKEYSIVYRSGHDKIDFRGAVSILNNIAKWMSTEETVNFGTEGKHLPPNMHQALGLSEPDSTHKVKAQAMWNKILQNPSIELKHKQGVIPGPGTKLKLLKFTKEESSAIYKACKGLGYSITQATSAAVALTLSKVEGLEITQIILRSTINRTCSLRIMTPVNLVPSSMSSDGGLWSHQQISSKLPTSSKDLLTLSSKTGWKWQCAIRISLKSLWI